jgi:hypothetical protein
MEVPVPEGVELVLDPSPASWIAERLRPWNRDFLRVGSVVPQGFEAYARILHRVWSSERQRFYRWREVAEMVGRPLDGGTCFWDPREPLPPSVDQPPTGTLGQDVIDAAANVLRPFTAEPSTCWYCVWEGYGLWRPGGLLVAVREDQLPNPRDELDMPPSESPVDSLPKVELPGRRYLLFRGALASATAFAEVLWDQTPNLWWPEDRAWFVASPIDLHSTYVGATRECIDSILRTDDLESIEVSLEDRVG